MNSCPCISSKTLLKRWMRFVYKLTSHLNKCKNTLIWTFSTFCDVQIKLFPTDMHFKADKKLNHIKYWLTVVSTTITHLLKVIHNSFYAIQTDDHIFTSVISFQNSVLAGFQTFCSYLIHFYVVYTCIVSFKKKIHSWSWPLKNTIMFSGFVLKHEGPALPENLVIFLLYALN